jgi:hypothetical protein
MSRGQPWAMTTFVSRDRSAYSCEGEHNEVGVAFVPGHSERPALQPDVFTDQFDRGASWRPSPSEAYSQHGQIRRWYQI